MNKAPEGVDPALWAEFQAISDRVHELHRQREMPEDGEAPPATRRMVLDVPEEWFLLFAWIYMRERDQRRGKNGATGYTVEFIGQPQRAMREAVRRHMWRTLNNDFHAELHDLATGGSHLLRPREPHPEKRPASDDPDGLPF